ncbi:MAG TPA: hypothetical protein VHM20_08345, partial [Gammaproteobacteria bacterium]|nr:hypothetical protein [Gammaproteobacteria bacterium]
LRKKIFLTEDYDVEHTETKIHVYDHKKNEIVKSFPGGEKFSLFKIRNSQMLALVDCSTHPGKTTLLNLNTFKEISILNFGVTDATLQINNDLLICIFRGFFEFNVCIYNLETHFYSEYTKEDSGFVKKCEILAPDKFAIVGHEGFAKIFHVVEGKLDYKHIISGFYLNAVALSEEKYFVCYYESFDNTLRFELREENRILKERSYVDLIQFHELILLTDKTRILGLTDKGEVYYICIHDLSLTKLELNLPTPINKLALTKNKNLLAIYDNDKRSDLGECSYTKNEIADLLYDISYPRALAEMIGEYASAMRFFPKPKAKISEVEAKENLELVTHKKI